MDATHSGFALQLRNSELRESITNIESKQTYFLSNREILAHSLKLLTAKTTLSNGPNKQ
jgi:hypothetical protein